MVNTKWQKWTLIIGKLVLCVLFALLLAKLVWQLLAPDMLYLKPPSRGQANQVALGQSLNTAQYHLFGEVGAEPAVATEQVDAPDTRLNLTLLGITFGRTQEESSAIIAEQNGEASFYRVKDQVVGRTLLSAVYADRVILDTNGNLETLKFAEDARAGVEARMVNRAEVKKKAIEPSAIREQYRNVATPAEFLGVTQQLASQDPQGMISQLGLVSQGAGQGYQVQPGSMLQSLNLRPGDVVLSVNGQRLGDLETDQLLLQDVSSAGSVRLEIQRGNQRFVINHQM